MSAEILAVGIEMLLGNTVSNNTLIINFKGGFGL